MNRLYYLFILLSLLLFTACNEEGPVVVNMENQNPVITTTSIAPQQGYVGEQLAITGTEFGGAKDFVKVFVGDFQTEIISCSDTRIVVQVPEEAVTGKVILDILGKRIATEQVFTVLDYPVLSAELLSGYLGSELSFTGTDMPTTADYFTIFFGEQKTEVLSYTVDESGKGTMTVKVPAKLSVGKVDLTVKVLDEQIFNKKYEVLASPVINAIKNVLVRAGSTVTFTGSGLTDFADKIKIDFNGISVTPTAVSGTSITAQVPDGFESGMVKVEIEGFPMVEAGEIQLATVGDMTSYVLQSSVQPFTVSGVTAAWDFNEAFTGTVMLFPTAEPGGVLLIQAGWGEANKSNAKMYQTAHLPRGKYKFTVTIAESGNNSGEYAVDFVVASGNATIPDLTKQNGIWTLSDAEGVVLNSCRVSVQKVAAGTHADYICEITLTEDADVTIGFVAQITNQGWVKISSVKVTLEE